MKNKCDCYHTENKKQYLYHPITGTPIAHDIEVGVCWGTKERDECSCGGDKIKCDFYPYVRTDARKIVSAEKAIDHYHYGVTHDIFSEPVTSYAKLAIEALEKQIPQKPDLEGDGYCDGEIVYDTGYCPRCRQDYEIEYHTPRYCESCGQALDWSE